MGTKEMKYRDMTEEETMDLVSHGVTAWLPTVPDDDPDFPGMTAEEVHRTAGWEFDWHRMNDALRKVNYDRPRMRDFDAWWVEPDLAHELSGLGCEVVSFRGGNVWISETGLKPGQNGAYKKAMQALEKK